MIVDEFRKYLLNIPGTSPKTAEQYIQHVKKFERFCTQKGCDMHELSDFNIAYDVLCDIKNNPEDIRSGKTELSNSYIRKIAYMVRVYYRFCLQFGHKTTDDPFRFGIGFKRKKPKKPDHFDPEDPNLARVLAYPRTIRDKALIWLLFSSAIRTSESINLKITDVYPHHVYIQNGKGGKGRNAPICPQTSIYINSQIDDLRSRGYAGEWLFPRHDLDGNMTASGLRKLLSRMAQNLKIDKLHPRMFRHSFAFRMLEAGAELYEVQHWLGHEDIRTTMIYTHPTDNHLETRYLSLEKKIKKY